MLFVRFQGPGQAPSLLARIFFILGAVALLSFLFFFAFTFFVVAMVVGGLAFLVQAFSGRGRRPGPPPNTMPGMNPPWERPSSHKPKNDDIIDV